MRIGMEGKTTFRRNDYTGDSNHWTGVRGWGTTSFDDQMNWGSGWGDSWGSIGQSPGDTSHYLTAQVYHYSYSGVGYGWQLTGGVTDSLWWRHSWPAPNSQWFKIAMYNNAASAGGGLYAGVFYDSNDSGYYLDPNGVDNQGLRIRGGTLHGPNWSWGKYLRVGTNGRIDGNASVVTTNGNLHLDCENGYETYINHYSGNRTYTYEQRTTFIYDYNNTGYYWDAAGYSQFSSGEFNNYCRIARLDFTGVGGNSGQGTNPYSIFQEGGGWGYPYPDLRIAYHVGIKFGANPSYEGMRFYTDYDMSGIVWQFNGGSSYSYQYRWNQLTDYHGIYTGINGAHFYPNNASYGSWRIAGSRNGWAGIEFDAVGAGQTNLMCNSSATGFHNNSYSWHFLRGEGTGYMFKNYWGGGTQATMLDSSNAGYAWNMNQYVRIGDEPRFTSHYFYTGTTSRHTGLALYSSYTMGVWEVRTDFTGISGGESGGIGINGDFSQFWNPGDIYQAFMFSDEDNGLGGYIAYLTNGGTFINSDERAKYSIRQKVSQNYEYIDRLMQLKPATFAYRYELKEDDTEKVRARKISKMLDVHQGLIAQDVLEVFPAAVHHSQDVRKLNFELSEQTVEVLNSVGITDPEEIEAVKQHYIAKGQGMEFDMYSLNWTVINTYQILALQDFKKMYDEKCEEIEVLKSDLALIKAQLGIS
jgi:hypothetical protein